MRKLMSALGVACLLVVGVVAQQPATTFEVVTVSTTAVGLANATVNPPGRAQVAKCTGRVETNTIRVRWDGVAPTSSVGYIVYANELIELSDADTIQKFLMIRVSGDAPVTFQCWSPR